MHAEDGGSSAEVSYFLDGAHTAESMLTCARWFADAAGDQAASAAAPANGAAASETQRVLVFNCTQVPLPPFPSHSTIPGQLYKMVAINGEGCKRSEY